MTPSKFLLLLLVAATTGLVSCSTTHDPKIDKVNTYKLRSKKGVITADPSISFEQKYYLYGAVSNADVAERTGNYYNVHWSVPDTAQPVKLVMSYCQAKSGATVHSKEIVPDQIKRHNISQFSIIGDEYEKNGTVTRWKIALVSGKSELAAHKSYLWE